MPTEIQAFFDCWNAWWALAPVLKAVITHLWFVTIHLFEDGNVRMVRAFDRAELVLGKVMKKTRFWGNLTGQSLNDRQRRRLNHLLDGARVKLISSKWAKLAKTSPDTALRDINDLVELGILVKEAAGGRSTSYELILPEI